jgi:hypothetical protein
MSAVAAIAGWLVAAVLTWAGVAKLRRPSRTAQGFVRLGVPAARVAAVGVPIVEIAVAVLLVLRPPVGAVAAVVVLAGLTAFAASRIARGLEVACGCFGGGREEPLTVAVPVRNILLMAAAAVAITAPATGPVLPPPEAVIVVGAAAAIGAVAVALVELRVTTGRVWDNRLPTGPGGLT